MASTALEEKIEKIRLQNEKIRQRYEEVEADKKNAAKANALVQLVPSDDWPERKEPPEFSAPPKNIQKQKVLKEQKDYSDRSQHYSGVPERFAKKDHKFSQGEGPPPDPKYNFLADSEREMRIRDDSRGDEDKNRIRNKNSRGTARKRGGGMGNSGGMGHKEAFFKVNDNRGPNAFFCKDEPLPEYEAWRAERNRIDEARISRQKTAEGNWRREWDSNKVNTEKDFSKKSDYTRKDSNNFDRRNNYYDSDYSNRGRTFHGPQRNHAHQDYRRSQHDQQYEIRRQSSDYKQVISSADEWSGNVFEKNVQVPVSYGNQSKGPLMSVKVNSPSIAGTGRVGPRQKSRVTYSDPSEGGDFSSHEMSNFSRQKSFDEKTASASLNTVSRSTPKSPFSQRKKESNSKSPYLQRKEFKYEESISRPKNSKNSFSNRNEFKDQRQSSNHYFQKPQRTSKRGQKLSECSINSSSSDNATPLEYNLEKPSRIDDHNEANSQNINFDIESYSNESDVIAELCSSSLENTEDYPTNIESTIQNEKDEYYDRAADETSELIIDNEECTEMESVILMEKDESYDSAVNETSEQLSKREENVEFDEKTENLETEFNIENLRAVDTVNLQDEVQQKKYSEKVDNIPIEMNDSFKSVEKIEDNVEFKTSSDSTVVEEIGSEKTVADSADICLNLEDDNSEEKSASATNLPVMKEIDQVVFLDSNPVLQDEIQDDSNEKIFAKKTSDNDTKNSLENIINTEQNDVLGADDTENKGEQKVTKEGEIFVPDSTEKNIIENQGNEDPIDEKNKECQKTQIDSNTDFEAAKKIDDNEVTPLLNEEKTELNTSKNEISDDSGFVDANESFQKEETNLSKMENDANNSISNLNEQQSEIKKELSLENNENFTKSDVVYTTKELSEKFSDICDNTSALIGVTIDSAESVSEKNEIQGQKYENLETLTKDNETDDKNEDENFTTEQADVPKEILLKLKDEENSQNKALVEEVMELK